MSHLPIWVYVLEAAAAVTDLAAIWCVQSTLVIALGMLAGWGLRRRGAAVQSAVYRVTLVAAIACPVVAALSVQVGLSPAIVTLPGVGDVLVAELSQVDVAPSEHAEAEDETALANAPSRALAAHDSQVTNVLPAKSANRPDAESHTWSAAPGPAIVVVAVSLSWLSGSMLILARLFVAHLQMAAMCRTATEAATEEQRLCRELASRLGVSPPAVLRTPYVSSPCLAGIVRPVILLPEELPERPSASVLVHELAHLRRFDCMWNVARQATAAVLFFQPLVWRLSRLIETTGEEVCDDYVVQHGIDRQTYADMLVRLAASSLVPASSAVVPLITLRSLLAQRVVRILDRTRRLSLTASAAALCPILTVALAATLATSVFRSAVGGSMSAPPVAQNPQAAREPLDEPDEAVEIEPAPGYKVGRRVVALNRVPIIRDDKTVDWAYMGWVYRVERVEPGRLWVLAKTPGWIETKNVIPFEQALDYFDDLLARFPDHRGVRRARALILMADERIHEAIAEFTELIRRDPKYHEVWNDRGIAWKRSGDYDRAIADYSEAIKLQRVYPVYLSNRGSALHLKGKYAEAIDDWKTALVFRPSFLAPELGLAECYATCPDEQFRNGQEALKHARNACELTDWESREAIEILAAAYAELRDFEEAVRWQAKAMSMYRQEEDPAGGAARLDLYQQGKAYRPEPDSTRIAP